MKVCLMFPECKGLRVGALRVQSEGWSAKAEAFSIECKGYLPKVRSRVISVRSSISIVIPISIFTKNISLTVCSLRKVPVQCAVWC